MERDKKIKHLEILIHSQGWQVLKDHLTGELKALEEEILGSQMTIEEWRGKRLMRADFKHCLELPEALIAALKLQGMPSPNSDPLYTAEDIKREREKSA